MVVDRYVHTYLGTYAGNLLKVWNIRSEFNLDQIRVPVDHCNLKFPLMQLCITHVILDVLIPDKSGRAPCN